MNTGRFSLKVKVMVDEQLPKKGLCYPEVFRIWGYMARDEGLVFCLLSPSAPPAELLHQQPPVQGLKEDLRKHTVPTGMGRVGWDPAGPGRCRRGAGKGDVSGTRIHLCPHTPALHSAKMHAQQRCYPLAGKALHTLCFHPRG